MELAVDTRGLSRDFGHFTAVDGIDLAVPAGSFYGFLGPNGAGKSTTIKCLTGLLKPTSGSIRILGTDFEADPVSVKRRIGVVPEDLALFDRLTAQETLTFVAQVHGMDPATAKGRSSDLLGLMDLKSATNTLVTDFSHGMRKKLSLAAALLPGPRLLFLDEPFEGIDAVASRQIKDLLQSFVERGGTIFLTSHILEIVERLSTHIGVIDKGKLVSQGPIGELRGETGSGKTLEELFIHLVGGESRAHASLDWIGVLRILRAFAWLRWRMLLNSFEKTGSRDVMERFSIAIEKIGPIIALLLIVPSALLLAAGAAAAGYSIARGDRGSLLFLALRYLLFFVPIGAIIGPLFLPAADRTNPVRMLLLPIPRSTLYVAQVSTALGEIWMVILGPILIGLPLGLAAGGAILASLAAIVAGILLLITVAGISALTTTVMHLVVRDRRRAELLGVVFIVSISMIGLLPSMLHTTKRRTPDGKRERSAIVLPHWVTVAGTRVTSVLPTELYVEAAQKTLTGERVSAAKNVAGLVAALLAVHALGLFAFARVLEGPGSSSTKRGGKEAVSSGRALPGLSSGASAVAIGHLKLALRTTRGRTILVSPVLMLTMFGVLSLRSGAMDFGSIHLRSGLGLAAFTSFVSLISILPIGMNQFAVDRAGLTMVLLSPLPEIEYLTGKAVGNAMISLPIAFVCVIAAFMIFPGGPLALWLSIPIAMVAVFTLVAPAAAAFSALFPRLVDLSSVGHKGNAHGLAGVLGMLSFVVAGAPCAAIVLIASKVLDRVWLAPLLLLVWCGVAFAISRVLFGLVVRRIFMARRENLATLVSKLLSPS